MSARSTPPVLGAAFALLALAAPARAEPPAAAEPAAPVSAIGGPPAAPAPDGTLAPSGPPTLVTPIAETPRLLVGPAGQPARPRLATRWWFWASLGGAAVGVVLAAIFIRPRDPYVGNANPGTVTIF